MIMLTAISVMPRIITIVPLTSILLRAKTRKCHKSCMVALYPRTSANDPSYEVSRSCLDDLDLDDRVACANGERELCKACDGSLCNVMNCSR
ncbi:hypothetical protein DOY81_012950 [Sarcophaga bullata]|nr:hypothetical protein DOY81_012950 [Sarcophaga bullata]